MTPSSTENRLAYLLEGPWAQKAVVAEDYLARKRQTALPLHSSATQALSSAPPARTRAAELTNIFRAHWQFPVTDAREQALRDSFDEALNTLQLIELGIETGYYTTDQVRDVVLTKFDKIFWSQASVDYLTYYQYVNIRFLAARYEVNLDLPPLTPPTPNPGAQVRYATFLSIFSQFYADDAIKACLNILDDDNLFEEGNTAFVNFLVNKQDTTDSDLLVAMQQVSEGFYKIILWLNDIFEVVNLSERKYFALFFYNWLIKLLGYTPTLTGYVQDRKDWITLISRFPNQILIAGGYELEALSSEDQTTVQTLLRQRLANIQDAWVSAQMEIKASNQ